MPANLRPKISRGQSITAPYHSTFASPSTRCHGPTNPPFALRQEACALLQYRADARPHSAQLATPRSPRHIQPRPAAAATGRHTRTAVEGHQARCEQGAVLGWCWCAAKRYCVAVVEYGTLNTSVGWRVRVGSASQEKAGIELSWGLRGKAARFCVLEGSTNGEQVGILEPQYRISKIQGQVVKADSAAKSLIPETPVTPPAEAEVTQEQKVEA